jgi:hypothetical protein
MAKLSSHHVKTALKLAAKLRLGLKLATDIAPKLPTKDDMWWTRLMKGLAVMDSVQTVLFPATKGSDLRTLVQQYDLVEVKNEQFVSLFFHTNLYEQFTVNRFGLNDYTDVIDASHDAHGRLFFIEYPYTQSGPEPSFYHTKGMDFAEVLHGLWATYNGRLHVTITRDTYRGTTSEFATFDEWPNPLYGTMQGQMDRLVARHRRFQVDGITRSYMFYGDPGTGKSSFAQQFAEKLGSKMLKLDATSFAHVHVKDVAFLLENLKPDFLLVDDVDKADVTQGLPTILEILQRFKSDFSTTSVILTANTVSKFDTGFLRPGRVDTWIEFPTPEEDERREILTRYLAAHKTVLTPEQLSKLVSITAGLSQDYLREVALLPHYEDVDEVTKTVFLMQKLKEKAKAVAPPPGGPQT